MYRPITLREVSAENFWSHALEPFRVLLSKSWVPLLVLTVINCVGVGSLAAAGQQVHAGTVLLGRFVFALLVVRWVASDRDCRRFNPPFEFDAFVFFVPVVVVPYYLCKTRGPRGLVSAMGFWALLIAPTLTANLVRLAVHR